MKYIGKQSQISPEWYDKTYDRLPALYDFEYPACSGDELDFWDGIIRRYGGPALELAVGTGRVALPLASLGHTVWGIDVSEPMLDRARRKTSSLPKAVRSRLHFERQDFRNFQLERRFKVIFAPFNSFLLLLTADDLGECMRSVADHLSEGGVFVIDAFAMTDDDMEPDSDTITYLEREPESGASVVRTRKYSYDPDKRQATSRLTFALSDRDGETWKVRFQYTLQLFKPQELLEGILQTGFEIREIYGNHELESFGIDSESLIVVCVKAAGDRL